MIWHNGRLYEYDGWVCRQEWNGWRRLKRIGRYPGYVRLVEIGTGHVLKVRSDRVVINASPI